MGEPTGRRSNVWKLWVPRGKDYACLTPSSKHVHATFHDAAQSKERPPFHLRVSYTPVVQTEVSPPPVDGYLAEWGQLGDHGPAVPLLGQVIIPWSELRERETPPSAREDVTWLVAPEPGEAAFLSIYSLPSNPEGVKWNGPPSGTVRETADYTMPNGRVLVAMASVSTTAPGLAEFIATQKARFEEGFFRSLAEGRAPHLDDGTAAMEGILPISARGAQAFLELDLIRFVVLSPGSENPKRASASPGREPR